MKTNKYILFAMSLLTLGTTSCSDFLDEDNKVGETADLTYGTKTGVEGLLAASYSYTRGWYGKEAGLGLSEMGTDLFYYGYDNKQKSLCSYTFDATALENNVANNPSLDHYWEMFNSAVDVTNNAIKYIGESTQLGNRQGQYTAEALFLRAFYHFHMVNIWGAIPYKTEPAVKQDLNPVRTPENIVYGGILQDLDQSIAMFEAANYKIKTEGRANYWAARALKARVLLYAASWLQGQLHQSIGGNPTYSSMDQNALYQAAINEADAVMGASDYASLYPNYQDMWYMENESYTTNKEALFGVTYSADLKTTVNCIPKRHRTSDGKQMDYNSLITRTGYSRGGSAMLLMFVSMWNNGATDVGNNKVNNTTAFIRPNTSANFELPSKLTGAKVSVVEKYSPYGRGFTRYLPSLRLWQLLEEHRATDQRVEATLLDHYDVASPDLYGNAPQYPEMQQDTLIYYCYEDGNSAAGQAKQAWAKNKYRIQFAAGGDIPVYTSMDPATALPTEAAKAVSDVYGDKRYNSYKVGGWCSFPGIKKFLDFYKGGINTEYPCHDISNRDAIVIRLPEMYLIKAEAQVALGQPGNAMTTINALRSVRAKAGTDNTLSGNADLDIVLNERAIELCGEQMRWFDLKRTGKLYDYVIKYNAQASPAIKADVTKKKFLYRPIPQNELDAAQNFTTEVGSTTGFWQNPGW